MSKGKTDQSVVQTDIPEYAKPYFLDIMDRATAESKRGYVPYQNERLAGINQDISTSRDMTRDIASRGIFGMPEATGVFSSNIAQGQQIAAEAQPFQYTPSGTFTGEAVQRYMSPYMQAVVDEQTRQARQRFAEQTAGRQDQAIKAGAFGGSRQGVQEAIAERDLLDRISGIQASGSDQAFKQGALQFGADRSALMAQEQAQAATNQQAQAAQLQALGFSSQQAQQMVGLGETGRAADIQEAQLLESTGAAQRADEQAALDLRYQDFLRQQGYEQQQISDLMSIMRGVPIGQTQTTLTPYNPVQQALGAGISALGLYKGLSG